MSEQIDEATVRHVAHLARLQLAEEEVAQFTEQFSTILGYFRQLEELDTTDVAPTAHPLDLHNVLRADASRDGCGAEAALRNAPDRSETFFRVPKVLDQQDA
jgi:aspartyl-tRNA(Asn)/glutamyl-tRNA(Gln) amidotransferase subunit C